MSIWLKYAALVVLCLSASIVFALFLFVHLLHAPPSHTVEALKYLVTSALLSIVAGTISLFILSRYVPSLGFKIGIAFLFGSGAAIVNVLYTPWLMFASNMDFYLLLITVFYFVAISLLFAYFIASTTTHRLRILREGAMRIAQGAFGTRVEVGGADEVADLAQAFNSMSRNLEEQFERERHMEQSRRDLIGAVSHDLRTPLASIRAMVEAVNDGVVQDQDSVKRYYNLIIRETQHLGQLIEDLFELSRLESGSLELKLSSVPLGELVTETIDGLRIQAEEKGVMLRSAADAPVPPLALDGPRMQRALVNLIENAVRHTPAGGLVEVSVQKRGGQVELAVSDSGEGIAIEDQAHLFDQFYRGERSRSRDTGGAGLGLAIARGIVEAHHGTIRVESKTGHGSRFVVTI